TSYWATPTPRGGTAEAIAKFVSSQVSEQQVARQSDRHSSHVQLVGNVPQDFFVRGSQLVDATTVAFEVRDGVLRLDRLGDTGTLATFWVDLSTRTPLPSPFGR